MDRTYQARVAALSLAHGSALARLLRAHGRAAHAAHVEAALSEAFRIVEAEFGGPALAEAVRWVAEQTDGEAEPAPPPLRH